jgi:hypothetical protein
MNVRRTVDQIFAHLRELGRTIAVRRRSGIDAAIAKAKLQNVGLTAPPELLELYSECDGTQTARGEILDDIHFFPGYYWMSLDTSLTAYNSLVQGGGWNVAWLPIFANGGGDFYAVVCNKSSTDFGGVVGFLLGVPDVLVEFRNVATMMQTIERAYAEKAFFVADGCLEANYPEMRAIARTVQPDFAEHGA